MKNWTKEELKKIGNEFNTICTELNILIKNHAAVDSPDVQELIKKHFRWLTKFWTPDQESYIGLGKSYTEPAWQKTFASYGPDLAPFLAQAMEVFALKELS